MIKYYKIPKKISYVRFANLVLRSDIQGKICKQFVKNNDIFLQISDEPTEIPESFIHENICSLPAIAKKKKHKSQICFSIRMSDIEMHPNPYEFIATRISKYPYNLKEARLHIDSYGVSFILIL